jgi:hypothetical protein
LIIIIISIFKKKEGSTLKTFPASFIFFFILSLCAQSFLGFSLAAASAQQENTPVLSATDTTSLPLLDLDRGIVRSLNIEESWVENAFYIHSVNADDLSRGNGWTLSGEMDFAFNSWFGGELDFPVLLTTYPLGQGPSGLGPLTLGFRVVPYQTGTEVSREAAILSFEVETNIWPTPQFSNFPGEGNSVSPELLWAFRYHRLHLQGITGYTLPTGIGAIANPFFMVSAGRSFKQILALQMEADINGAMPLTGGKVATMVTVLPEIAYMPYGDRWLNEVGEGFTTYGSMGPQPTTYFMMEFELGLLLGE